MARLTNTLAVALLIAAPLVSLAGCSSGGDPLSGTQWKLVGGTISSSDLATVTITAKFAGGQVSGSSGVNSYGGPYTVGPGEDFSAGPLAGTLMAGPEPAMRAETAYLRLLGQATSYKLDDGKLTLFAKDGRASLTFAAFKN